MSTITTTTTTTTPSKFFHITAFNSSPISTTTPGSSSPTATTTILAYNSCFSANCYSTKSKVTNFYRSNSSSIKSSNESDVVGDDRVGSVSSKQ
ncbi:1368_t:CDS:2 [Entrophospora sp. SA101]|nr:1368_t:CDS:2 [Entrophospora sp. SA101]